VRSGVGDSVGGIGMTSLGSIPGGTMITPGVPLNGGVTTIGGSTPSGVGVNVGARVRVARGVGAGR
jgi:hypothetical protein